MGRGYLGGTVRLLAEVDTTLSQDGVRLGYEQEEGGGPDLWARAVSGRRTGTHGRDAWLGQERADGPCGAGAGTTASEAGRLVGFGPSRGHGKPNDQLGQKEKGGWGIQFPIFAKQFQNHFRMQIQFNLEPDFKSSNTKTCSSMDANT